MRARAERHESTDHRDCADSSDPTLSHDPPEITERAEPIDPADRALPTEPTDSTDPTDPIDRTDPTEPMDRTDSCDQRDSTVPEDLRRERETDGPDMWPSCPVPGRLNRDGAKETSNGTPCRVPGQYFWASLTGAVVDGATL